MAIKVLGRQRFFTGISLFGISFTLMILILLSAFLDAELGEHQPLGNRDRLVFLDRVIMKLEVPDTTYQVDSNLVEGQMVYDSIPVINMNNRSFSSSSLSYSFADRYLRDIAGAVNYSFYSSSFNYDLFVRGKKLSFEAVYADERFWDIYNFRFLQGRPFRRQEVEQQSQVTVMTKEAAEDYFGTTADVLGQFLEIDGKKFEVIGIVDELSNSKGFLAGQIYLPVTTVNPVTLEDKDFLGPFEAVFLAQSPNSKDVIQQDLERKANQINMPNPDEYNELELMSADFLERYAHSIFYMGNDPKRSQRVMFLVFGGLLLLFILLPTLNLINLNISRIMERSAEIGVRKAYGANAQHILSQLVFENVILTFVGGFIGLILALSVLYLVNDSSILPNTTLRFNASVFFYSLLICLAFGIISGLLPAWRMSRIQIVNAIKQNQL
jgi:putative ABC transport system permease protein